MGDSQVSIENENDYKEAMESKTGIIQVLWSIILGWTCPLSELIPKVLGQQSTSEDHLFLEDLWKYSDWGFLLE